MRQPNHTPLLRLAALLGLLVLLTLCVWPGHADFGDFSGDSDFGGSDFDGGWDSDGDWDGGNGHDGVFLQIYLLFAMPIVLSIAINTMIQTGKESRRIKYSALLNSFFYQSADFFSDWSFRLKPISALHADRPDSAWFKNVCEQIEQAWTKGNNSISRNDCTAEFLAQYSHDLQTRNGTRPRVYYDGIETAGYDFAGWNEDDKDYIMAVRVSVYIRAWTDHKLGRFLSRFMKQKEFVAYNRLLHYGLKIRLRYSCVLRRSKIAPAANNEGKGWLLASMESMDLPDNQPAQAPGDFAGWGFRLKTMNEFPSEKPNAAWIHDLFRRMQDSWGKGDISSLQKDFTADCYTQFNRQLQAKNKRGEKAHCIVNSTHSKLAGWNEDEHEYMLAVEVMAVIIAWNENGLGKIISGSDKKQKEMRYAWVLRRGKEITAAEQRCPSCGHTLPLNYTAVCPHCGAQIEQTGHGWAISSIQAISQKAL